MHSSTFLIASALASLSSANIFKRASTSSSQHELDAEEYYVEVCLPTNSSGLPLWEAPCWAEEVILAECSFGSASVLNALNSNDTGIDNFYARNSTMVPAKDQQACICQSQFFNTLNGCISCATKHGLADALPIPASSALSSFSSSYCAVTNTPSKAFAVALATGLIPASQQSSIKSALATTTKSAAKSASKSSSISPSFSDPIGNKTDISLYFTPSVSGSAAYIVSQAAPTSGSSGAAASGSSSGSSSATTTINTSNGQIVATPAAKTSGPTGAATAAAMVEKVAVAGAAGFAAMVALL